MDISQKRIYDLHLCTHLSTGARKINNLLMAMALLILKTLTLCCSFQSFIVFLITTWKQSASKAILKFWMLQSKAIRVLCWHTTIGNPFKTEEHVWTDSWGSKRNMGDRNIHQRKRQNTTNWNSSLKLQFSTDWDLQISDVSLLQHTWLILAVSST